MGTIKLEGGDGGKRSADSYKKHSEAMSGKNNPNYAQNHCPEKQKQKLSKSSDEQANTLVKTTQCYGRRGS